MENSFVCSSKNCGKKFPTFMGLRNHMATHRKDSVYNYASQANCHKSSEESKEQVHSKPKDKVFTCMVPDCGRIFQKRVKLQLHRAKDHKRKRSEGYAKFKALDAAGFRGELKAKEQLSEFQLPEFFRTRMLPLPIQVAINSDSMIRLSSTPLQVAIRANDVIDPLPGTYSSSLWLSEDLNL